MGAERDEKTSEQIEQTKKKLLEALEKSLGVVTAACAAARVGRTSFYNYYNDDALFKAAVDDIQNVSLDFAESQLFKQIQNGNVAATIFYLKTKGKKRGYIERTEIQQDGGPGVVLYLPDNGRANSIEENTEEQ